MSPMIQYLLYNVVVPAGSVLAILVAVLRFFGEKIFGHLLDQRLQKEKERHEVALTKLKHEQDAQIEDFAVEDRSPHGSRKTLERAGIYGYRHDLGKIRRSLLRDESVCDRANSISSP